MSYLDTLDIHQVDSACEKIATDKPQLVEQAGGDVHLALYLLLVNRLLWRKVGVRHSDLADFAWAESLAAGDTPADAANRALRAEGIDAVVYD